VAIPTLSRVEIPRHSILRGMNDQVALLQRQDLRLLLQLSTIDEKTTEVRREFSVFLAHNRGPHSLTA